MGGFRKRGPQIDIPVYRNPFSRESLNKISNLGKPTDYSGLKGDCGESPVRIKDKEDRDATDSYTTQWCSVLCTHYCIFKQGPMQGPPQQKPLNLNHKPEPQRLCLATPQNRSPAVQVSGFRGLRGFRVEASRLPKPKANKP